MVGSYENFKANGKVWHTSDNSDSWPDCMDGSDENFKANGKV